MPTTVLRSLIGNIDNFLSVNAPEEQPLKSSEVIIKIPDAVVKNELKPGNQIERVPPLFRNKQSHRDAYDPVIVSIGPYYHGKPEYQHAEAFKKGSLEAFLEGTENDKSFFVKEIEGQISKLRGNYEKLAMMNDNDLVSLILSDACFFIYYVQNHVANFPEQDGENNIFSRYFGPARLKFIIRDLILVENQIPFWVIELLVKYSITLEEESSWSEMLRQFMSSVISMDFGDSVTLPPWEEDNKPLHFLGAYYQALKLPIPIKDSESSVKKKKDTRKSNTDRFRSITNLKAKGIRLNLSKNSPNVISFNSYTFYGQLNLPPFLFTTNFFVLYSNLIAYEMSASSNTLFFVSSMVSFMKLLIDSPGDVKILREKGILISDMVMDEEVVRVIKSLDTFGLENAEAFSEVKDRIERHCRSRTNSLLAEMIHTYFTRPWNVVALMAAILIVALTTVQAYYAIHPSN